MKTSGWPIAVKQLDGMTVPTIFCFGGSDSDLTNQTQTHFRKLRMLHKLLFFSAKELLTLWWCCFGLLLSLLSLCALYDCQLWIRPSDQFSSFKMCCVFKETDRKNETLANGCMCKTSEENKGRRGRDSWLNSWDLPVNWDKKHVPVPVSLFCGDQ